jgi:hypothetical protein
VVHAVVASHDLSFVNRTGQDRGWPAVVVRGGGRREDEDSRERQTQAHLAPVSDAGLDIAQVNHETFPPETYVYDMPTYHYGMR